jgi:hypothetical protein
VLEQYATAQTLPAVVLWKLTFRTSTLLQTDPTTIIAIDTAALAPLRTLLAACRLQQAAVAMLPPGQAVAATGRVTTVPRVSKDDL